MQCEVRWCERARVRVAVLDLVGAGARRRRQFSRTTARSRRPCGRRARPRDLRHGVPQLPWPGSPRRRARRIQPASCDAGAERSRRRAAAAGDSGVAQGPHIARGPDARRCESAGRLHPQRACAGSRTGCAASRSARGAQGARRRRGRRTSDFSRQSARAVTPWRGISAASAHEISVTPSCRICGLPEDGEEAAVAGAGLRHRLRR